MARLIADAPTLKAAVDHQRSADRAGRRQRLSASAQLEPAARHQQVGRVLATVGASERAALIVASQPAIRDALAGRESFSLLPQPDGILQLVTVPIAIGLTHPEILGTLSVGFLLDNALAAQLKEITGSDIAFGMDGQILATTLPREDAASALAERLGRPARPVTCASAPRTTSCCRGRSPPRRRRRRAGAGPVALILRSRTEQLRFLQAIHTELAVTAVVAVLLATLLSFAVARTITRPLAAITDVMREVAATGDLTRKIALRHANRWDDEDARLLATTFNTLTDSIARFQREMSQKERLSSLGRLSTVIAHEVRNPLMIIKASLHALRQPDVERGRDAGGGRRHRRRSRAPQPHRQRGARLRAADPLRAGAGRSQRALPRVGGRRRGIRPGRRRPPRSRRGAAAGHDRRRAAAHRARQHARQRAARRERTRSGGTGRRRRRRRQPRGTRHRRGPRDDRRRRPRRRHRPGRPAARLRSLLHDQARRHRASACRSPRTSSTASAAPSA